MRNTSIISLVSAGITLVLLGGCSAQPKNLSTLPPGFYYAAGLNSPTPVESVKSLCTPPRDWKAEPLKSSDLHTHQVWISPTGNTAYGVIHFKLPIPVGANVVHWEFLREMKKRTGEATEFEVRNDPSLPGLRFVCEGGLYKMRVNLTASGFDSWAAYAGTLRTAPENPAELDLAVKARENTQFGIPDEAKSKR